MCAITSFVSHVDGWQTSTLSPSMTHTRPPADLISQHSLPGGPQLITLSTLPVTDHIITTHSDPRSLMSSCHHRAPPPPPLCFCHHSLALPAVTTSVTLLFIPPPTSQPPAPLTTLSERVASDPPDSSSHCRALLRAADLSFSSSSADQTPDAVSCQQSKHLPRPHVSSPNDLHGAALRGSRPGLARRSDGPTGVIWTTPCLPAALNTNGRRQTLS